MKTNQTIQEYQDTEKTEKQFFKAVQELTSAQEDLVTEINLWDEVQK